MSNTLLEITDAVYGKMHIKSDSTVFDRTKRVIPLLNKLQDDICVGSLNSAMDPGRSFLSPILSVVSRQSFLKTVRDTTLTADAVSGSVSLSFDTTDFPSSGALYVSGCSVEYTGKTASTVTGVTGLVRDLDSGTGVKLIFAAPTAFSKPYDMSNMDDGENEVTFIDDRDPKFGTYYTIKKSSDGSKEYLYVSREDATFRMDYVVSPTEMVDDTDVTALPSDYGVNLLASIAAGTMLFGEYGEDSLGVRGKGLLMAGYAELTSFYAKFAVKTKKHRKVVQRKPWKGI